MPREKEKRLTEKELAFARNICTGMPVCKAFFLAGYKATNNKYASLKGSAIKAKPHVNKYIKEIQESQWLNNVMSIAERRAKLAEMVRATPADITEESPIASVTIDAEGNKTLAGPKVSDKIKAIEVDSRLAGDLTADDNKNQVLIQLVNERLEMPSVAEEVRMIES